MFLLYFFDNDHHSLPIGLYKTFDGAVQYIHEKYNKFVVDEVNDGFLNLFGKPELRFINDLDGVSPTEIQASNICNSFHEWKMIEAPGKPCTNGATFRVFELTVNE